MCLRKKSFRCLVLCIVSDNFLWEFLFFPLLDDFRRPLRTDLSMIPLFSYVVFVNISVFFIWIPIRIPEDEGEISDEMILEVHVSRCFL